MRRKNQGQSYNLPVTALAVLVIADAATYPLARVSMTWPAAIAGELQPEQARELLQVLVKNVYRAFDFREEQDVYDKLAMSVSGKLLADLYLQNRRSFAIKEAGGAQARIQSVEIQGAVAERLDDRPLAYAIRGNWASSRPGLRAMPCRTGCRSTKTSLPARNFHALEQVVLDLDARLKAIVVRDPAKTLFASHHVYQYLARRYSLNRI